MSTLAVPGASAVNRRPLSTHGLPKAPRVTSPNLPHRFSGNGFPSQTIISTGTSPRSPGPMSPPMSARSFGTFIDSEPSTPAYSPRMDHEWDSSSLVLLRPTSSSSEPASPTEPVWDMIMPPKRPQQAPVTFTTSRKEPLIVAREMSIETRLAAPPVKKVKATQKAKANKEVTIIDPYQKENEEPRKYESYEVKSPLEAGTENSAAPFGKLASKMKLMLRRRSTGDKKKEKKEKDKEKDYYDPVEDVHWTEM